MAVDNNGLGIVTGGSPMMGKSMAEASIASAKEQVDGKVSNSFYGYIDGGTLAVKAADGSNLNGKIVLERGIKAPQSFDITLIGSSVTGQTEKVILFSQTAYSASCGEVCLSDGSSGLPSFGAGSSTGAAKWYIGDNEKCGAHRIKHLRETMMSTGLNLGSLRLQRLNADMGASINISTISIKRGNFVGDVETVQTVNVASQVNPQDRNRDITDIPLTGASKRLDKDTWFELNVPALEQYRLTFTVLTYFQYL